MSETTEHPGTALSQEEQERGYKRPLRRTYKHERCGKTTTLAEPIAEGFAINPTFYDKAFCAFCIEHRPLDEFVWPDGSRVGS